MTMVMVKVVGDLNDADFKTIEYKYDLDYVKLIYPYFKEMLSEDTNHDISGYVEAKIEEGKWPSDIYDCIMELIPAEDWGFAHTIESFSVLPVDAALIHIENGQEPKFKRSDWRAKEIALDDWLETIKRPIPTYGDHMKKPVSRRAHDWPRGDGDTYWADDKYVYCLTHECEDMKRFTHLMYFGK